MTTNLNFEWGLLTPEYILVARDPRGFRPLCIGRVDGRYVVASETCAFDLINAEYIRDVEPGEVLRIAFDWSKPLAPPGNAGVAEL